MILRAASTLLLLTSAINARVTRIVIEHRDSPAFNGQVFGNAGQYETLSGHFYGELDAKDPHNAIITDIALAPRIARGLVDYSATFAISKPIDMSKSSGVLFYSVPNRGGGAPTGSTDGHVSVVSGWQGDITPRAGLQTIAVPIAKNADGSSITGPVIERFINMAAGATTLPINTAQYAALNYQRPVTLDTAKASLTRRATQSSAAAPVPSADWAFADCASTPFPGTPDPSKICVKNGFDATSAYELVFTAKDPLVLGIGFAATRDLNSFLRYSEQDSAGNPNPVAKQIKWALSRGNSQSGNFIRSFINLGFNQDENRRVVWDGVNPHIAARQLALNIRFANPGGAAGPYEPGSEGVLWWSDYADSVRHRPAAGLLDRCKATNTCPKIMETFGGLEFWYLRESPNLVGTDAKHDIPLPANVRRYFLPATGHGGGRGGFNATPATAPAGCLLPANPNPENETLKALIVALVDWVTKGVEPPASLYPRLDRGELASATGAAIGFPSIPGVPSPDGLVNAVADHDFGRGFIYKDLSGVIAKEPPSVRQLLPTLVPKVDADGMDMGGVPSVLRQAPLGTYLGWNPTASGFDKGRQCGLAGGYVPFAATKTQRVSTGDPRLSLEERYGTHAGYVAAVRAVAEKAVSERFLLRDDADQLIAQASASKVLADKPVDLVAFRESARILFQGDSITDGNRGRSADPNHILGHGYAFIVAAKYGAEFPERHLTFLNRGVSGNTLESLAARWQADTIDLKPSILSILIGINDLGRGVSAELFEKRYDQLLADTVKALPEVRLVLGEPFGLPGGKFTGEQWEARIIELRKRQAIVEKLANKYHAALVRYQKVFDEAAKRAPSEYWIWDSVHPTYSGHQLMADEWVRVLRSME